MDRRFWPNLKLANSFGNAASRNHPFGWQAEEAVDNAREQVAKLIGADPKEIIFTSGATEGDNLGIKGVFEMYASKGNHIITCTTEHKAVLDTCKHIEKEGGEVTYLKVKPNGLIDLAELEARHHRFDVINIKLDKCGGLTEGLMMARRARELGKQVMVGNMCGTSLAAAPAFVLGQFCDVVDLDGPIFLKQDRTPSVQYGDGHLRCGDEVWGPRVAA